MKNKILNSKMTKIINNYLLMDKIDREVKNLFIETSKEILEKANLEKNELKPIIKRLNNLIYTEKSNRYYLNEISNSFFYDYSDLRIHTIHYKKFYKEELEELKKEFSFECGKAIDWIGTKPPLKNCEYLRPVLCETIMNNMEINYKKWKNNVKIIKTIEIVEEIIKNNEIKECVLKKTLKYDKKLINYLKQK